MPERDFMKPGRSVALAEHAMVATSHPAATLAALDVLRAGGNAVDAALTAVALQGVLDPHMTGIGGDCFALYAPAGQAPVCVNGSGPSPAAVRLDGMLPLGAERISEVSAHAVTVPGAVGAWVHLSEGHGRIGLERVLAPAIDAAEKGFTIAPRVAHDWFVHADRLRHHAPAATQFLPGGRAPAPGERLANPALGPTLRKIAQSGARAFYEGEAAEDMVGTLRAQGGVHTADDFARGPVHPVEGGRPHRHGSWSGSGVGPVFERRHGSVVGCLLVVVGIT